MRNDLDIECEHGRTVRQCNEPGCVKLRKILAQDADATPNSKRFVSDRDGRKANRAAYNQWWDGSGDVASRTQDDHAEGDGARKLGRIFSHPLSLEYAKQIGAIDRREQLILEFYLEESDWSYSAAGRYAGCSSATAHRDFSDVVRRFLAPVPPREAPKSVKVTTRGRKQRVWKRKEDRLGSWAQVSWALVTDRNERRLLLSQPENLEHASKDRPLHQSQMRHLYGALAASLKPVPRLREESRSEFIRRKLIDRHLSEVGRFWAPPLRKLVLVKEVVPQTAKASLQAWKQETEREWSQRQAARRKQIAVHSYTKIRARRHEWDHNLRWAEKRIRGRRKNNVDLQQLSFTQVLSRIRGRLRACPSCHTPILVGCIVDGKRVTRRREYCDDACKMRLVRRERSHGHNQ